MAAVRTFSVKNPNQSLVAVHGSFTLGSNSTVSSYTCSDGVVAYTGTGRWTVTLNRKYPQLVAGFAHLRQASAGDQTVFLNTVAATSGTFEIRHWDASGGALDHPTSGDVIDFVMFFLRGCGSILHELESSVKDLRCIAGSFRTNSTSAPSSTYHTGKGWASVSSPSSGIWTITLDDKWSELVAGFAFCSLLATETGGCDKWAAISAVTPASKTVEVCVLDSSGGAVDTDISSDADNWVYFLLFVRGA